MNDWSMLKKLIWLRIIKGGGSAVLKTVTGALIHVTNALALPAEALSVNVEPIQDLHGYDSPWPAGGGKNLFNADAPNLVDGYITETGFISANPKAKTVYIQIKPNTTYTASKLAGKRFVIATSDVIPSNGATFTARQANTNMAVKTITSGANDAYLWAWVYLQDTDTVTLEEMLASVQIEVGSTATAYAPYSNICPISGRTSATVTRCGKNLVDTFDITDYSKWSADIATSGDMASTSTKKIYSLPKFASGLRYTISFGITPQSFPTYLYFGYYKDGVTTRIAYVTTDSIASQNISFMALEDVTYCLRMSSTQSQDAFNTQIAKLAYIQLELGSTASTYEPYAGNTYTIQLGQTVYGGQLDVTGGKMVVDRAMVDLGTLSWNYSGESSNHRFSAAMPSDYKQPTSAADRADMICSAYASNPNVVAVNNALGVSGYQGSNLVFIRDLAYTDVATFKAAVSGVQLVYELATPIEITLTPTQIDMLLGENNLWADAGDSTLTYYADGNASTSEALGILLGGTYNNPGGADDVSDDEALGILLGGS